MSIKYLIVLSIIITSCGNHDSDNKDRVPQIQELLTPNKSGGEPNLFASEDGTVFLSWLEYVSDTSFAFQYATMVEKEWSSPQTIATGSDWFVNWADFPSLVAYKGVNPSLATHRLVMSAAGTYDYDIMISQADNTGRDWSKPFKLHTDDISAEHGFVSMLPLSEERIFATWLDGRYTKSDVTTSSGHDHAHGGGPMTLRAATFNKSGQLFDEVELDDMVCDCCQTSAAKLEDGIIVAYRNRTEEEIRDIAVVRKTGDTWLDPVIVYPDNWKFPACPVNGPVVQAHGKTVAVGWFTMNDTIPEVKVAFSIDGGKSFKPPIRIDHGNPLGRVDLVFLSEEEILVSWLEKDGDAAAILALRLNQEGPVGTGFMIAPTSPSRSSGFPRIVNHADQVIVAWTHVENGTQIRSAMIHL